MDVLLCPAGEQLPCASKIVPVFAQLTVQTAAASCGVHAVLTLERLLLFDQFDGKDAGHVPAVRAVTAVPAAGAEPADWAKIDWNEGTLRLVLWLNFESAKEARKAVWPRMLSLYVWE